MSTKSTSSDTETHIVDLARRWQNARRRSQHGMRARGSLITSLYAKALRRSTGGSSKEQSSGKRLNLITTDCTKLMFGFQFAHMMLSGPLQIVVAVYLLYQKIQWTVFVGLSRIRLF